MKVLLTGATSGIGFETLKQLVNNGCFVYAIGRDFSKIELFLKENRSSIETYEFDLAIVDNIENIFSKLDLDNGKLDAMIHCAGIEETTPLIQSTPEKLDHMFNINVFSGIELLRSFSKKKYCNDGASVVFLSSVMGILGQPGKIGYCASKAAVLGVVKSSALELARRKIRVNAVLPGIVNTPMTKLLFESINESQIDKIKEMHPLGFGEVEDVVPTILFLISDKARWITGQSFVIDGGYSVH
ncbi:NAD(P)-dependent dehydrogenase, short-chain alcohol dehydrogenase family [Flavobacterium resistens]|uniref:NAD(P)-dependent dehydrogenase, short-chain alcohol dehydrogenase family n=1 Tax=Flavobacterium resistens TaxID=443612 RepID=A0A521ES41_9FLAO|nr:SDR family oxidoreductase [Flavobacterium resistens]MRX67936.1 SDR family oxidoreductase [Flavobacterium resistens]SMO86743.1 NAD(P)-dependent dehydrogenase, short-chain alcohol dehydrogenase family [Flavobacterium resistens]